MHLLDVDCSSAWLAPSLLGKVDRYVGVERSVEAADRVDSRMALVSGTALQLPFPESSFDAVCLFDVIEHLPRGTEMTALQEAHRVLQPGGTLYFSTPHASLVHSPLDPVWLLGHRHYRRGTVRSLISNANFEITRLFVAGGFVEGLDHIGHLAFKHLLKRQQPQVMLITRLIDGAHGTNRWLGMTVFAAANKPAPG